MTHGHSERAQTLRDAVDTRDALATLIQRACEPEVRYDETDWTRMADALIAAGVVSAPRGVVWAEVRHVHLVAVVGPFESHDAMLDWMHALPVVEDPRNADLPFGLRPHPAMTAKMVTLTSPGEARRIIVERHEADDDED